MAGRDEWGPRTTIDRRQFVRLGALWLLGSSLFGPFPEELNDLFGQEESPVIPVLGEVLPFSVARETERESTAPAPKGKTHLFLTFDDGPLDCTAAILDQLDAKNHAVTFFVIGRNLTSKRLRKLALRALEKGHELASHSYSHPYFSMISERAAQQEITGAHKIIQDVVREAGVGDNRQNRFFRFPYGDPGSYLNYQTSQEVLNDLGYQIAWWDLDTQDWRMELSPYPRKPAAVIASFGAARPRDVVLLHDRTRTAQVLPSLLEVLQSKRMTSLPLSKYTVNPVDTISPL